MDGTRRAGAGVHRGPWVQPALDVLGWAFGLVAAIVLRYDLKPSFVGWSGVALVVPVAAALQLSIGFALGLYRRRWRYGSFEELAGLTATVMAVTAILYLLNVTLLAAVIDTRVPGRAVPASVPLGAGLIALVVAGATRYGWRFREERALRPDPGTARRVVVFGAGNGGAQVLTAMLRNPSSPFIPVALLDDDPSKRHLRIMGVPVQGTRRDLDRVAVESDADSLLVAIPSADAELIGEMADLAQAAGLETMVLPPVSKLFGSPVGVADIRPVTDADLLGRHQIDIDVDAIAGYLRGRKVLVTGAGGSIGSELCRQIQRFGPAELMMLDRDESALHAVELSIEGRALLEGRNLVLCDIRDADRVRAVLLDRRPDVIFHAAALKHLPLLETHPAEAVKTNVWGTQHLLAAALEAGTERFVNVSTDKAADPCSVLGYSKRVGERLTAHAADASGRCFLSVRFGNVLGSRGSVLTAFHSQIDRGGPVTVTHPEVTRYFMTVEEAVRLVIQAGAVGRPGEALVLDMGQPVRIADVARRLVARSGRTVEIQYTGLRSGEKLHESLFGAGEVDERPYHELISHVAVPALSPATLGGLPTGDDEAARAALRRACALAPVSVERAPAVG